MTKSVRNVRRTTAPAQRTGDNHEVRQSPPTNGEGFVPASPEALGRIDELVSEVWGMRPAAANVEPDPTRQYISFGLAGVGQWGLGSARRQGDEAGAFVPVATSQAAAAAERELYVMADGTVWWQLGDHGVPVDVGARGAEAMISILETVSVGVQRDPRDCMVDGRPLTDFLASASH